MTINKYGLCLLASVLWFTTEGWSQNTMTNNGANMVIANGASVVIVGDFVNSSVTSVFENEGTVVIQGSLSNTTNAVVQGNGLYKVGGNWNNTATFIPNNSTIELFGNTAATMVSGSNGFYNLTLNKGASNPVVNLLTNALAVTNTFTFTGANNKLQVGNLNLTITNPVVGFDATKYIITNGTGKVIATTVGTTPFTFPIGSSSTSYTPLSISQTGTALSLGIKVQDQVLTNGTSGSALTNGVVNKSWAVTEESVPVPKNLNLIAQWNSADELSGMDATRCGISAWNTTNIAWDLAWADVGARTGSNPYSRTRNNISEVGTFAVGSKPVAIYIQLSLKAFLQGAYTSGGLMNEGLRSASLIPMAENTPAASGQIPRPNGYIHQAWGGNETAEVNAFNSQVATNDNIVDWVFVELRDPSVSSTILHTRAALLQRDGDIVNEDGTTPLKIYGVPDGAYFVSIRHRNHIGIITPTRLLLNRNSVATYDFTTAANQALGGVQKDLGGGKFGMYAGNVNGNNTIRTSGPASVNDYLKLISLLGTSSTILSNTYNTADVNMDGIARASGPATINDYLKLVNVLSGLSIITQPF